MKALVLSDLHLSHRPFAVVIDAARIDADVVVLAGFHDLTREGSAIKKREYQCSDPFEL